MLYSFSVLCRIIKGQTQKFKLKRFQHCWPCYSLTHNPFLVCLHGFQYLWPFPRLTLMAGFQATVGRTGCEGSNGSPFGAGPAIGIHGHSFPPLCPSTALQRDLKGSSLHGKGTLLSGKKDPFLGIKHPSAPRYPPVRSRRLRLLSRLLPPGPQASSSPCPPGSGAGAGHPPGQPGGQSRDAGRGASGSRRAGPRGWLGGPPAPQGAAERAGNWRDVDEFLLANSTIRVQAQWPFPQADYPRQRLCCAKKEGERSRAPKKGEGGRWQQSMLSFVAPDI